MKSIGNTIKQIFQSRAYKEGWEAGRTGTVWVGSNPYNGEASLDNVQRGMGGSPDWATEYKPFLDWQSGWYKARAKFHPLPLDLGQEKE